VVWMQEYVMKVLDGRRLIVVGVFGGILVGRVSKFIVLLDVIVDKRFDVVVSHVVVIFLYDGTGHEAC
jgi:hypothetical protein